MFIHYLKIAWRNLLKYRTQTAVSVWDWQPDSYASCCQPSGFIMR